MALAAAVALLPPIPARAARGAGGCNALVLLAIGCPCVLAISTPVAIVAAPARAARAGVPIQHGTRVAAPACSAARARDKTGARTEGGPQVAAIHPLRAATRTCRPSPRALQARPVHPRRARSRPICAPASAPTHAISARRTRDGIRHNIAVALAAAFGRRRSGAPSWRTWECRC